MVWASAVVTAAFLSTGLISVVPNVLLVLFPNVASSSPSSNKWLSMGQALAAGGLLGDVFLHTLPHCMLESSSSPSSGGPEQVGGYILLGYTFFLLLDVWVRTLHPHDHDSQAHSSSQHDHSNRDTTVQPKRNKGDVSATTGTMTGVKWSPKVLLNLTADALHNFTDGLAIGASFAASAVSSHGSIAEGDYWGEVGRLLRSRGGLATVSVLLHEIPHELGDFAILMAAGYTKAQAIRAQFFTALAALAGTAVGLYLGGTYWDALIPMTAGGFIYLAASTLLPELLSQSQHHTLSVKICQLLSFALGVAFMMTVSLLEHHDHHDESSHHHHHHEHPPHHDHDHHIHHDDL